METSRATFADALLRAAPGDAVALLGPSGAVTFDELGARVRARAEQLDLPDRSVVVLTGDTSLEYVITYLALLDDGHVPLLAARNPDRLVDAWDPVAVVRAGSDEAVVEHRHGRTAELHPELRLLMSTSGSTGSPKLVRLSDRNLERNARAIAEYLRLGPADVGITSLPLHYCYGLSVLHSHLVAGAAVVLTDTSVVDPCFRRLLLDHRVTNVAGVPHSFEMLERLGAEHVRVPTLRYLTVAGGRMAPDAVLRWVERTESWGAEFFVMYGQTEATARMAYLPPALARRHPGAIGVPIPDGELELRPVDGTPDGVGELVYRGPNVMLGYATEPADLALGATLDELRTGDLGRYDAADGVFEIVGRRSRFVKPFGVRIDLDAVEGEIRRHHDDVAVAGDDDGLVLVALGADADALRQQVAAFTGLPTSRIVVRTDAPIPRTDSGKVDTAAVLALGRAVANAGEPAPTRGARDASRASVAAVYAAVLGRTDVRDTDTFVSLGGDSLSYVECSVRLEQVLGRLPADWHLRPIGELAPAGRPPRLPRLDTTAVLRAIGICTVVATHMRLEFLPGGAHLLLAVVGFNLSRFLLPVEPVAARLRAGLVTAARTAIPVVVWVAVGLLLGVSYGLGTLLLVNNYTGPQSHAGDHWHFWFIEVFVHLTVLATVVMAVPAVRRLERRYRYGFPLVVLAGTLALRLEWAQLDDWYNLRYRTHGVAWFFVLGWLIHRSETVRQRLLTTAICLLVVPGFFRDPERDWYIAAGLVALVWWRSVPMPRPVGRVVALVAAASMWILITHFTVWPPLVDLLGVELAYVPTIAAGVLVWAGAGRVEAALRRAHASRSLGAGDGNRTRTTSLEGWGSSR